jgi:signal transduction histidine kinase
MLLIAAIAVIGIATSIWGYSTESGRERDRQQAAFKTAALNQSHAIESYVDFTLSALPTLATSVATGLRAAQPSGNGAVPTKRQDWAGLLREPMQNVFRNYHAIRTLAWVVHRGTHGRQSFAVEYLQYSPFYSAGNARPTRETDFARNSGWADTMQKALESGRIALSPQAPDSTEVLAFMPVFRNNSYTTRQQRQTNLSGFIVAVIDRAALLEIGLQRQNLSSRKVAVTLHDMTDSLEKIRSYLDRVADYSATSDAGGRLSQSRILEVGGRTWLLQFEAATPGRNAPRSFTAWLIFFTGFLLTGAVVTFLITLLTQNTRIEHLVGKRTEELNEAHRQLRDSEMLLVQAEKMSALGQMVAGIAHEINTPLGFAKSNLQLMQDHIRQLAAAIEQSSPVLAAVSAEQPALAALQALHTEDFAEELAEITAESLEGIARISDIVISLKDFSRMDRLAVDDVDLHQCIDSTLVIAHNTIKHKADVIKHYGDIPSIHCAASQINQVLLNILTNAAQAMDDFGSIVIATSVHAEHVHIVIQDNGKGMSEEVQQHIFEPFYTTKQVGEGTGLGLAISDKIVRQHYGRISVQSTPDLGTTFTIVLPIRQTRPVSVAEAA